MPSLVVRTRTKPACHADPALSVLPRVPGLAGRCRPAAHGCPGPAREQPGVRADRVPPAHRPDMRRHRGCSPRRGGRPRAGGAMPSACTVVLDLSEAPAVDDGARAALRSLGDLLVKSHARLRLVVPEAEARAALSGDGAGNTIGPDALYPSIRAAVLAAHAALPGPALVTPAMRALLWQPPELLLLPPATTSPERHEPAPGSSSPDIPVPRPGEWRAGEGEPRPVRPNLSLKPGRRVSPSGGNRLRC